MQSYKSYYDLKFNESYRNMHYSNLSKSCDNLYPSSRNYQKTMESFYYNTEILHIAEILPNRLYFGIVEGEKALPNNEDTIFFNVDNELIYLNYYYDFGPLNISCLYKYCQKLNNYMSMPHVKRVVHYTLNDPNKKVNSAYLMGSFAVLYLDMVPRDIYKILLGAGGLFRSFVDASQGTSNYTIRLVDCLQALEKARMYNFFDFNDFNVGEYDTHDKLQNGDMNWIVPRKFLAFIGPTDGDVMTTHSPDFYLAYFIKNDVRTVIRLNNKVYNAEVFKQVGIDHHELFFQDGSVPPKAILKQFLHIAENAPAAIAVHCKAGLGRTGSLIGAYIMKHYKMSARESIAWMRICRPGSVIGQQQAWLEKIESWLWKQGSDYRVENFGDGDKIPHHRYGIYSVDWQQEREKLRRQSRMKQNPELLRTNRRTRNDFSGNRSALDTTTAGTATGAVGKQQQHQQHPASYIPEKLHFRHKYMSDKSRDYKQICDLMSKIKSPSVEATGQGTNGKYRNERLFQTTTTKREQETQGDKLNLIKANRIAGILPNSSNLHKYVKETSFVGGITKKKESENVPPNRQQQHKQQSHIHEHVYNYKY